MNICVFGASSKAIDGSYLQAVEELGEKMARRGHSLVFGGGASGLMGAAARGSTRGGGSILGVAPSFFNVDGILYEYCTDFIYTDTMRERKQIMEERSDAVVMTPGGIGTFEEFFEMLTLKQLGRNNKPIAVFNVNGYFDTMQEMLEVAVAQRFMSAAVLELYRVFRNPDALLDYLETYNEQHKAIDELKFI